MRVGLLTLSIGNFGETGFYNAQDIGLAKCLDGLFSEVIVYRTVEKDKQFSISSIEGCRNSFCHKIPSKKIGTNAILDLKFLDKNLDIIICFSDTQLFFPSVYKWARKNNIKIFPYIGVIESHSHNKITRLIMSILFYRNVKLYKNLNCIVKNSSVRDNLYNLGVKSIDVVPVGLDLDIMKIDFREYSIKLLKQKHGYFRNEKIILFIGRLVDEKQPLKMIEIFSELLKQDDSYRLLIIGRGELKETIVKYIKILHLESTVKLIEKVPNSQIWEYYRIADTYVNLNKNEIFGMSILEAMYYECKVVAWKAPGPQIIIENKSSGYLVESQEELVRRVLDNKDLSNNAHRRVIENFTWAQAGNNIFKIVTDTCI